MSNATPESWSAPEPRLPEPAPADRSPVPEPPPPPTAAVTVRPGPTPADGDFRFDGGAATFWGTALLGLVITVFTLGICYPFAVVLMERWRAKHTFIEGRQLKFTGSAFGLFGRWLLVVFVSISRLATFSY
ncbi:MAG: DUF898 family protein [Ilumatobacter sp.]|nr:DUF898 family protein [Ilumatobacter sp.]